MYLLCCFDAVEFSYFVNLFIYLFTNINIGISKQNHG